MKLLIKNTLLFCIVGLLLGEAISRLFSTTSDIPSRIIDQHNIQKYKPNQTGTWIGGTHSWLINEEGWPGPLPKSKEKLITIIGDSYVENFMNPTACRQSVVLKKMMPSYNYYEASRSGISFIEAMEIASHLDSLRPIKQLIYVHDADFLESVVQIKKMTDIAQYDTEQDKVIPGVLKSPGLKKILYNWKFMYYLYTNYSFGPTNKEIVPAPKKVSNAPTSKVLEHKTELQQLITFVTANYNTDSIVLVYRPNADPDLIQLLKDFNFKLLLLVDDKKKNWSFEHDAHWTCIGHEEAAKQVKNRLKKTTYDF
ncbi:hypothetical protein ACFQZJ_18855 [Maribacter chungangensis]|uniref:SGNH/GDSL hydrolase family protein n=1 Tax=Maribacter chungangensis TaxID=1069117 RepID=A0ABW3B8K6_9FLAO